MSGCVVGYGRAADESPVPPAKLPARRVSDGGKPGSRALIVGFAPRDAGTLAGALQSRGMLALLGFDKVQVERCLMIEKVDVVIVGREGPSPQPLPPSDVALITVDRRLPAASREIDVHLPAGAGWDHIASRATALLSVSRAVPLPAALCWGPLQLDVAKRQASWHGAVLLLTPIQFRILEVLVLAAGAVVTSATLSRRIWGGASFDDAERIQAHIRRIRRKIEADPSRPAFLLTIRGEGYRLTDCEVVEPAIDLTQFQLATTRR